MKYFQFQFFMREIYMRVTFDEQCFVFFKEIYLSYNQLAIICVLSAFVSKYK
jgi:hypothetical protein